MKRLIIFLATIFLVLTLNSTQGATITGETITGKITSQVVNINITVTVGAPTLSIISPENETYLTNTSLLLNYATTGVDTWYNLNKKHNTTINSPTYFNTSEGLHTLYLYTNNSNSTISKNVTFTVNMTKFVIIDDEYEEGEDDDEDQTRMGRHPKQGSSTDFLDYSYEDLQNLCNIILENADYGRIQFNEAINVTDDLDSSDNQVDLNTYTNISFNRIELNATALPNFNKQATLWLYNLNFTNPRILKDGSVCSSTICTEINYSGGTLEFNVTGFSVYSAEETPSSSSSSSTSTGGGGGSGWIISTTGDFEIEPEEIKISLKQGETQKKEIIIRNTGDKILTFNINKTKLKEFIYIDETEFEIEAGETKRIQVRFVVDADTIPNLYMGGLIISSETTEIEIPVAIEVESKGALFDVEAVILKKYKNILLGEELVFQLNLYNLGGGGKVDVTLEYIVKDLDGNEIIYEHEDLAIETQASHVVTLETPNNMELGRHVLYVKLTYNGETASSSSWFFVVSEKPIEYSYDQIITLVCIIGIIIGLILVIWEIYKIKGLLKSRKGEAKASKKIQDQRIKAIQKAKRVKRIKEKLGALEKAYAGGHISKKSYQKARKRIKNLLNK